MRWSRFFCTCLAVVTSVMTSARSAPAARDPDPRPCDDPRNRDRYACDPSSGGSHFYVCNNPGVPARMACPPGLFFDNALQACNWARADYSCKTSIIINDSPPGVMTTARDVTSSNVISAGAISTNPCRGVPDGKTVCNPATGGRSFYTCHGGIGTSQIVCPAGLLFDNDLHVCTWAYNNPTCLPSGGGGGADGEGGAGVSPSAAATTATSAPADAAVTGSAAPVVTVAPPSGDCNPATCKLPTCRCLGNDIPGALSAEEVPQMVLLTFDDDVNSINSHYYDGLYPDDAAQALRNPNGCRSTGTFFVSDSRSDIKKVASLVTKGNEAASHSTDHTHPAGWNYDTWVSEIEGQRQNFVKATGLPESKFPGMRAPYLELGGDKQFTMLQNYSFTYDATMVGGSYTDDGAAPVYPFTLDYPPKSSVAMCDQPDCPVKSYPGLWEVPIVRQYTTNGLPCSMTDDCGNAFNSSVTKDEVMTYLRHNFNRHFLTNRAPFMISLHATWFTRVPSSYEAVRDFLREVNAKPEVWQISVVQMLDWMKDPKPLSQVHEIPSWQCRG